MKSDARVRYTKMVIKQSFLSLLSQKNINNISVKEICDSSEINRSTFYNHYKDAYDLLEQIQNEMCDQIQSALINTTQSKFSMASTVLSVVNHNLDLCKILFSEHGDKKFLRRIADIGQKHSIELWKGKYSKATQEQLELVYLFISNGSVAIIESWVNHGLQEDLQNVGEFINKINNTALAMLEVKSD